MPIHRKNLVLVLLGIATLIEGALDADRCLAQTPAQKKAQAAQNKEAMAAFRKQEGDTLKRAYILLAVANSNYAGHKGKAMHEVETALQLMEAGSLKQIQSNIKAYQDLNATAIAIMSSRAGGAAPETQVLSDAQVANAGGMLQQIATVLVAANKQPKVVDSLQTALKEIGAALQHSAAQTMKGKEADVLTMAYILLAAANHDYDGHRVKAMRQVEEACHILTANILKRGGVDQKIKALQDANAEALANSKAAGAAIIHERQALSDGQLLMADSLIQRVAFFMNASTQPRALGHMANAHREIGIALTIR